MLKQGKMWRHNKINHTATISDQGGAYWIARSLQASLWRKVLAVANRSWYQSITVVHNSQLQNNWWFPFKFFCLWIVDLCISEGLTKEHETWTKVCKESEEINQIFFWFCFYKPIWIHAQAFFKWDKQLEGLHQYELWFSFLCIQAG